MGTIVREVLDGHLSRYPSEIEWLRTLQSAFDITWASDRRAHGSKYSVYFLRPLTATTETFGFDQEILLVYSPYPKLEARTFQSIDQFLSDDPAKGRVDRLFSILVSEAKNPEEWASDYSATNESRTTAVFSASEMRSSGGDSWFSRNKIASQVFSRDLFDFRLPLERDTYFFGRSSLLLSFKDAIRRGENRGLFGLRKTGKTSFLYKLQREIDDDENAISLFYDCKNPSIRQRTWSELIIKMIGDLSLKLGVRVPIPSDARFLSETLAELIKSIPERKRVLIIFDEVEYISAFSQTDAHWESEYLPFWQTIWGAQSATRRLSVILAGVSPKLVEVDKINRIQNPLFGIVTYEYLRGLNVDELRRMLSTLGRRMGMKFNPSVAETFSRDYGGHPLLCRLAASHIHKISVQSGDKLPISITNSALDDNKSERDANLTFYCGHVISELRDFYPDEYQVFEYLACGNTADYIDFSSLPEYRAHLEAYGLVKSADGLPEVAIPVVGTHVALEAARRDGRRTILKLIALPERGRWLSDRLRDIDLAFSDLKKAAVANSLPPLFGVNSYPESHRLMSLPVVDNLDDLQQFLNTCNRCLVESIEIYGKSIGNDRYFWVEIKDNYPRLQNSLHRIKIYRHNEFHLSLNKNSEESYRKFLNQDLEGRDISSVEDFHFTIQQATLDSLWNSLQVELSRYGR